MKIIFSDKKIAKIIDLIYKIAFIAIDKIEYIIELPYFKKLAFLIILPFITIQSWLMLQNIIYDYENFVNNKKELSPIKITIADSTIDLEEKKIIEYKIKNGDNFSKILTEIGINNEDASSIINLTEQYLDTKSLAINDIIKFNVRISLGYNKNNNNPNQEDPNLSVKKSQTQNPKLAVKIEKITINPNYEREIIIEESPDGKYQAKENKIKIDKKIVKYYGKINNGMFSDGVEAGISPTAMMQMINLYSYDIDFQRDIKSQDKFEMLIESFYNQEGKKIKDGNVLYSSISLQNKRVETYLHEIDGRNEYFDSKGNSIRKSLLKTPINGARVSSGFGFRRHPILGYSKMHKGTDFAAITGTPILAAGNGLVVFAGKKGGYGNYIEIKHNKEYSTAYAHANNFSKKIKKGIKVQQGEVIAYVGSTGRSTGPHLHFELIHKGQQINPSSVKSMSGIRLAGKELLKFNKRKQEIDIYRQKMPNQFNISN